MALPTDFSALATRLISLARRDVQRCVTRLEDVMPSLVAQIRQDALRRGPLSFWGRSRNMDENTQTTIVDPSIIAVLATISGRTMSTVTPHAGLQHTYGYLFSTIETPYGFKRDRWIETQIEQGFGLNHTTLSPFPDDGTLLTNATWLSGAIAFRGHRSRLKRLKEFLSGKASRDLVSSELHREHLRCSERIAVTARGSRRGWTLQTDVVKFPFHNDCSLLVYSIIDELRGDHRLITVFPVANVTRNDIEERAKQSIHEDVRTRYNAYVPALADHVYRGRVLVKVF